MLADPNTVQTLKCVTSRQQLVPTMTGQVSGTVRELLNVLVVRHGKKQHEQQDWLEAAVQDLMDEIVEGDSARDMQVVSPPTPAVSLPTASQVQSSTQCCKAHLQL